MEFVLAMSLPCPTGKSSSNTNGVVGDEAAKVLTQELESSPAVALSSSQTSEFGQKKNRANILFQI
jgi:hypothetical protein